jgi:tetratricopeptide (TPR) repeat protein
MAEARRKAQTLMQAGTARAAEGDLDGAQKLLRASLDLHRHPLCLINFANVLADSGDNAGAAEHYEEAIRLNPQSFEAHANAALLACEDQRRGDAARLLRSALAIDQSWFDGWYNLANLLSEDRSTESEALRCYETALRLRPTDLECLLNRTACLVEAGKLTEAVACATSAVDAHPQEASAHRQLAHCRMREGSMEAALAAARRAEAAEKASGGLSPPTVALLADLLRKSDSSKLQAVPYMQAALRDPQATPLERRRRMYSLGCLLCHLPAHAKQQAAALSVLRSLARSAAEAAAGPGAAGSGAAAAAAAPDEASGLSCDEALLLAHAGEPGALGAATRAAAAAGDAVGDLCVRSLVEASVPGIHALVHKAHLARFLQAEGLAHLAPPSALVRTMAEVEAAMEQLEEREGVQMATSGPPLWFLKHPRIDRGQGIAILTAPAEAAPMLGAHADGEALVLQLGVPRPALLGGHKFGLRVHALVVVGAADVSADHGVAVWVHDDAVLTRCGAALDGGRADALTHVACTSVQRGVEGFRREAVKGPASAMWPEGWPVALRAIRATVGQIVSAHTGALRGARAATGWPDGAPAFQVLGADFVADEGSRPWLLELNASPQFGDPLAMPSLRAAIGAPMLQNVAAAVAASCAASAPGSACESYGGWRRLTAEEFERGHAEDVDARQGSEETSGIAALALS